jgi:hypothetical protein
MYYFLEKVEKGYQKTKGAARGGKGRAERVEGHTWSVASHGLNRKTLSSQAQHTVCLLSAHVIGKRTFYNLEERLRPRM